MGSSTRQALPAFMLALGCVVVFGSSPAVARRPLDRWGVCNKECPGFRFPTFAPSGSVIARNSRGRLYRLKLSGQITSFPVGGGTFGRFGLSPDGTRVAGAGEPNGLFVGDLRTSNAGGLHIDASSVFEMFDFAWSPDGRTIAFQVERDHRCCEIWTMAVDGIQVDPNDMREFPDATGAPTWTPGGTKIVTSGIRVIEVAGGGSTEIRPAGLTAASAPDVSPDGRTIAFAGWRGDVALLYVMNLDGSDAHAIGGEIYAPPEAQTLRGPLMTGPTWSPDGRKIAFLVNPSGRPQLDVVNADGSGLRVLAEGVSARARPSLTSFSWSTDGRTLALLGGGDCSPVLGVFTISVNGRVKRELTPACRLLGTRRGETLVGSRSSDRIEALAGNDRILARDGKRDTVSCGSGRDAVVADKVDRVAADCERISRT